MKKMLTLIFVMGFTALSSVTALAAESPEAENNRGRTPQQALQWGLSEYRVSRVVVDTSGLDFVEHNENDIIATGLFFNGSLRASGWKAYHGNNSSGVPYGRLTNDVKAMMQVDGLLDYSNGEAVWHTKPAQYVTDFKNTVKLVDGGTDGYGSGYSKFYYFLNESQVHESTSPLWFDIN